MLTPTEAKYWPTELEIAALVWTVKKLRHLIEASHYPTRIFTDHQAIVDIVKQSSLNTTSVVRLNLRHVRLSEYLLRFNLDIRHKPGKDNIVPDALSRLPVVAEVKEHLVNRFRSIRNRDLVGEPVTFAYPITVAQLSSEFKARLREAYQGDRTCARILEVLQGNEQLAENVARLLFTLHRRLIYFDDSELGLRLVIPKSMEKEILTVAHD